MNFSDPLKNKIGDGANKTAEVEFLLGRLNLEQKGLAALLDVLPVGVGIATDTSCQVIRYNAFAAEFFRADAWDNISFSAPEQPSFKALHRGKELTPEEMPIQLAAWDGKSVSDFEVDCVWNDGVNKTALFSSHPIRDDKGNIAGALAVFQDITTRKQQEKELKERDEQLEMLVAERTMQLANANRKLEKTNHEFKREILRCQQAEQELQALNKKAVNILDSISDAFLALDREWRFTYFNTEARRQLGIQDESKVIGKVIWDVLPNYADITHEMLHRAVMKQTPVRFEAHSQISGSWYDCHAFPSPDGISIYFLDITDVKEAEETLRQSEERFCKIFHNSPDIMNIIRMEDDRYIDINQRFVDVLGYTREEVIGRTPEELKILADEKSSIARLYKDFNEQGKLLNFEVNYRAKSGKIVNTLCSTEIINLNDKDYRLTVVKDITNEKKMEAEIARLDRFNLIGEIAAGIAHEIRNPMTVVRGNLQVLQLKEEFASHQKRFSTMIEEIDRANAIITEFLSLAKNAPQYLKKQSLNGILTALFPLIQADTAKYGIAVSISLSDTPEINLDEKQIRQLILNLVRNGIEAMSKHGVLTIKTRLKKDRVVLVVKDRGEGIPPEVLEKLGTPFFTTKERGTGLGLPICYRIAESHNARIDIRTGKRGTTFMVSFPTPSHKR